MTLFILLATLLTLAVMALLGWIAWRSRPGALASTSPNTELNIVNAELALLRQQRQELEQDVATARLASADHEATVLELSARADTLLQDRQRLQQGSVSTSTSPTRATPSWFLILSGLMIPVLAVGLYLKLGTPAVFVDQSPSPRSATVEVEGKQISINELVARLEQKLNEQPDQTEGWVLLGHTKYKLGDYAGAATALRRALTALDKEPQQSPDLHLGKPDVLADLADALVMQQQGAFSAETNTLVQQALQLNPAHQKSLALAAGAAMRSNNKTEARGYWERLRATLSADAPERAELDAVIADLGGAAAASATTAATTARTPATPQIRITGTVTLAAALKEKVQAGDTLFVYARRTGANAPRMPLAVARFTLTGAMAFPQSFELTEAMAMAPGMSLADAGEAEITARISRSGNAITASGDLNSAPQIIKPRQPGSGIKLLIDQIVP